MTSISPLQNVLKKGLYGDYKEKNSDNLIKIKEVKLPSWLITASLLSFEKNIDKRNLLFDICKPSPFKVSSSDVDISGEIPDFRLLNL